MDPFFGPEYEAFRAEARDFPPRYQDINPGPKRAARADTLRRRQRLIKQGYAAHTIRNAYPSEAGRLAARPAVEAHQGIGVTDLLGLHDWFKRIGLNQQLLGGPERVRHLAVGLQGLAAA